MPRPSLTEDQRRAARRNIQRAAAELYAESGLANISVRAIAKKAGVSVGTIYSYYENLTVLMQSLWQAPVRRLVTELSEIAETEKDPIARIQALLARYVEFALNERAVYRGAFLFVRPETHDQPTAIPLQEAGISAPLLEAVEEGQALGLIRPGNAESITQLLWAGVHGAVSLPINLDRIKFDSPEDLPETMINTLIESIRQP